MMMVVVVSSLSSLLHLSPHRMLSLRSLLCFLLRMEMSFTSSFSGHHHHFFNPPSELLYTLSDVQGKYTFSPQRIERHDRLGNKCSSSRLKGDRNHHHHRFFSSDVKSKGRRGRKWKSRMPFREDESLLLLDDIFFLQSSGDEEFLWFPFLSDESSSVRLPENDSVV